MNRNWRNQESLCPSDIKIFQKISQKTSYDYHGGAVHQEHQAEIKLNTTRQGHGCQLQLCNFFFTTSLQGFFRFFQQRTRAHGEQPQLEAQNLNWKSPASAGVKLAAVSEVQVANRNWTWT